MFSTTTWDEWPCSHDCTSFFRIHPDAVSHLVPRPLRLDTETDGQAGIEVGYARFRASHCLQPFQELSWGIAVKRRIGRGMAFYCPSLTSDEEGFLDYNEGKGFHVYRPTVRFRTDFDRRSFAVDDAQGNSICILRHQPEGSFTLPFFLEPFVLGDTEVWTGTEGKLQRRLFRWRGVAKVRLASPVASTLNDHPFFQGAEVSRAEAVPYEQFISTKVARAVQLFTMPESLAEAGSP